MRRADIMYEFVTVTGETSAIDRQSISKKVRAQAMRDYLQKKDKEAVAGRPAMVVSINLKEPAKYQGRFKLSTWSHAAASKSKARRERDIENSIEKSGALLVKSPKRGNSKAASKKKLEVSRFPNVSIYLDGARLDPFDSLSISLGPHSESLLFYYHKTYTTNSLAINAEGNFFSFAKSDPALFHAILFLVALHRDLTVGLRDSTASVYHGAQVFRILNGRLLKNHMPSDFTIAAVANLAARETLDGNYHVASMHMGGLEQMVRLRGGISSLNGVLQRVVAWTDLSFSNAWSRYPLFPPVLPLLNSNGISRSSFQNPLPYTYLTHAPTPLASQAFVLSYTYPTLPSPSLQTLDPSTVLTPASPLIPIISSLRNIFTTTRTLEMHKSPPSSASFYKTATKAMKIEAGHMVYRTEYTLLTSDHNTDLDISSQEILNLDYAARGLSAPDILSGFDLPVPFDAEGLGHILENADTYPAFEYPGEKSSTLFSKVIREALYIYLYLVVREISPRAKIIELMLHRLKDVWEQQAKRGEVGADWAALWDIPLDGVAHRDADFNLDKTVQRERQLWLFWASFVGVVTSIGLSAGKEEGEQTRSNGIQWWLRQLQSSAMQVEVESSEHMKDLLANVVWEDGWGTRWLGAVWKAMQRQ